MNSIIVSKNNIKRIVDISNLSIEIHPYLSNSICLVPNKDPDNSFFTVDENSENQEMLSEFISFVFLVSRGCLISTSYQDNIGSINTSLDFVGISFDDDSDSIYLIHKYNFYEIFNYIDNEWKAVKE